MSDIFTTREIALGFWTFALLAFALATPSVRRQLPGLIRTALHWKLVLVGVFIASYTGAMLLTLRELDLWNSRLLKDAALWFAFGGMPLGFRALNLKGTGPDYRRMVTESIRLIVFLEFLLNTYTVALPIELLLVPSLTLLGMLDAVADLKPEFARAGRSLKTIQALVGFVILGVALYMAVGDPSTLTGGDSVRAFLLPPILTALFIPGTFLLNLLSAYEMLFLRLDLGPKPSRRVARYAKWGLISRLGLRPNRVKAFTSEHAAELMRATSRQDIDRLLADKNATDARESGAPDT